MFELNDSTYCVQYVNSFIIMYSQFLPLAAECKNPYIHLKYEVANDIKDAEFGINILLTIGNICSMKKVVRTLQKTYFCHKN